MMGRRLSRRRRRLVWTAVSLAVGLGVAALVALQRYRQPVQYSPGEANPEITRSLIQDLPREAPTPAFTDVTSQAGLAGFVTFAGERGSQLPEDMGPGAAWGDYDNDGDDDLFLVSAGGPLTAPPGERAPSALFENLGAGRFRRVAEFPEPRVIGMAAAWGDYDRDGWIDLIVTGYDALVLVRNDRGRFAVDRRFTSRQGFWSGAAWGDYDNDGDLDFYVCGYVRYVPSDADRARVSQQYGTAVPYTLNPASYEPERNLLFRNRGDGTFVEVGARLGVSNPEGRSLSALWHDFDDDGWIDLYVANDISDNVMYRNLKGRFEDVSHPAWVADHRGAMGLAAGDWNRDGDDDLFITHWVAQENALYDSLLKDTAPRGGALRFVDAADMVGLGQIALPMVGWGTEFADFDADGWLDLIVANGSTFETEDTPRRLKPQLPFLFWNRRGEFFHNVAPLAPALSRPHAARGLAVSDFDRDGDMDVLIARHGEGVQLLRNDMKQGHWIKVVLRSRPARGAAPAAAVGARAVAHVGSARLRRAVTSASYLSQSTVVLHFGLGGAPTVDRLDIHWRGDRATTYPALAADRVWEITEGDPAPREIARAVASAAAVTGRDRVVAFWDRHSSAMRALKVERDVPKAVALFRDALALDPAHEDARYYLGNALAAQGDTEAALAEFAVLVRQNPRSHRARARWGTLRAATARSGRDLEAAEAALAEAYRLNPEETGALLTLGEVALLRGQRALAEERLSLACRTNARATGGFFLLGYLRWRQGDASGAARQLEAARRALGPDWKPAGTTAEGDIAGKAHTDSTPLSRFWDAWDGAAVPAASYARLDAYLKTVPR